MVEIKTNKFPLPLVNYFHPKVLL